ncbi:MOSPD2 family protein [Megaselia abdita]
MGKSESVKPTAEQIGQLREMFMTKLQSEKPSCGEFHPKDLERVKTNDMWLGKFLDQVDFNFTEASNMLWNTLNWRKNYGANEMDESKIRMDYIETGALFAHNKDVDGKTLLLVRSKNHVKGSKDMNELIKILVYWIERIQRETNYDKLTLFFDMQGAGLANMDLEFVKKIIETFKLYYPSAINYIVIFEMAWVLNAAFKIIKGLLPPKAVEIMKFLNTKTIKECVDADNSLKAWGGNDDYTFKFVPEKRMENNNSSNVNNNYVTFADTTKMKTEEVEDLYHSGQPQLLHHHEIGSGGDAEKMLRITPCDLIVFAKKDGEAEITGTVEICCIGRENITYKIKTTSPEKFLVRPSSGILQPGTSAKIHVTLQKSHTLVDINKDKFLVMSTYLPENMDVHASHNQITELWKSKNGSSPRVENHRLKCCSSVHDNATNPADGMKADSRIYRSDDEGGVEMKSPSEGLMVQLLENNKRLEKHMKRSQIFQVLTILALIVLITLQIYTNYDEIFVSGSSSKSSEL